jgi:hypothetical protein
MARPLLRILLFVILLMLPVILLVRVSVFCHEQYRLAPWSALLGGVLVSGGVIFLYLGYLRRRLRHYFGDHRNIYRRYLVAFALVAAYCFPALFYFSATNAKHDAVHREFRELHPILRLGVSTVIWVDRGLIITDANRYPDDYRRMGLRSRTQSLHYRQSNGYAHAVDIRTIGHGPLRNSLLETYFRFMGFNTLRHVGTADHLHVSLSSHDRPGAI